MTDSDKGWKTWRTIVLALRWLKNGSVKIMHLHKKTGAEIRTAEKARQKGIRREMRGLSNQPHKTGDRRSQDETAE